MASKQYKNYTKAVRQRVLAAARNGENWKFVAKCNDVVERTVYGWIRAAQKFEDWGGSQRSRGGFTKKIQPEHVDFLPTKLAESCELTLNEVADYVFQEFGVEVHRETVPRALDARAYTIMKIHRDVADRNTPANKQKRRDYVLKFYSALSARKVFYMDETNFNLWCSRGRGWSARGERAVQTNVASKGKNIHVIAVISNTGLEYHESRFGSFNAESCNEIIRRALTHISQTMALTEVAFVLDNAPCHSSADDVFEEEEFREAMLMRLGPYSPMLNPIENVFSAYKAHVKRFLARQRPAILRVPLGVTATEHRAQYLSMAADILLEETVTADICSRSFCHSLRFHQMALDLQDMPVGA